MASTGNNARNPNFHTYGGAPTFADDLTEIAATAATYIGESIALISALPTSGNWTGRRIWVTQDGSDRVWTGTAWLVMGSVAAAYTPTITNITGGTRKFMWWWSGGEVVVSGQVSGILFSAITGGPTISLPLGSIDQTLGTRFGSGVLVDASLGEVYPVGVRSSGSSAVIADRFGVVGGNVKQLTLNGTGATSTNGAVLTVNFRYRPA